MAEDKELVIRHTWIPADQIPRVMKMAVVAAEDDRFYQHHGFDWEAMKKAQAKNEKAGKIRRGGSTITQQLAKNLYLSPSRSYWRKGREAFITVLMERLLPKDRILELYLNLIEFGPGVFGVEEAARYHFRLSARQLSLDQAARLAAIIPSPRKWRVNGPYVSRRAGRIARIVGGAPKELEPPEPEVAPDSPEPEAPDTRPVPGPRMPPQTAEKCARLEDDRRSGLLLRNISLY